MRKILFSAVALLALAFLSCNKSELEPTQETVYTIKATIDNYGTKSAMNGNTVTWVLNEEVALFKNDGTKIKATVTEVNGVEATLALETGTADGVVAALYPYNDAASYANNIITTSLDTEHTWAEGENNKAPMAALVTDVNNISFKNAGALIALTVNNIPAGYNSISLSSGIGINGTTEISFNNNGIPSATVTADANANKKTAINFTATKIATNKVFYFPIGATETNTGITIELSNGTTTQKLLDNHAMSKAVRNTRYYKTINFDALGLLPTQTSSDDINTEISSGNTNFILDASDNSVEITTETTADVQIAVTSSGNTFTLEGEGPKGKVNLSTPAETQVLTLDVPNATVELKPDAGVATFEAITATTAENTLIIPAGVTVNNLTVNGGNVRVLGKILSITNGKQNGKVTIYKESGADIPADLATDKFDVITPKAEVNVTNVEDLNSAISDATVNDVITLGADLTMSEILVINKNITLDGNGHKLTSSAGRAINVSGVENATIKNLVIQANGERGINVIQGSKNIKIENVSITALNYAINVASSAPESNITISKSNLSGLNTINIGGANTKLAVTDSHITCNDKNDTDNYGAISINADGTGSNVIVEKCILDIKDDSYAGNIISSNSKISFTNTTCNKEIVIGEGVCLIEYGNYAYSFETIYDAIEYAKAGETVKLVKDITTSDIITINKAITIDLNSKTVTANCKKAFEVYADATIKNGTINSLSRCVDTRTNVNLNLENVNLSADKYHSTYKNPQPLTIGGSTHGTIVTLTNVNIDAGQTGYCIISFVQTDLDATNCTLTGYSAYYAKGGSEGSTFDFNNCSLTGDCTNNDVAGNSFAVIAIQSSSVTVNVNGGSVIAKGNNMYAIGIGSTTVTGLTSNAITVKEATITGRILDLAEDDLDNNIVKIPNDEAYKTWLDNAGLGYTQNDDGTITIKKN